jgi:hypothetical protein
MWKVSGFYFSNPGHIKGYKIDEPYSGYTIAFSEQFFKFTYHRPAPQEFPLHEDAHSIGGWSVIFPLDGMRLVTSTGSQLVIGASRSSRPSSQSCNATVAVNVFPRLATYMNGHHNV